MTKPHQLSEIKLFSKLALIELEKIGAYVNWTQHQAGKEIITRGEESSDIYLITEGIVRATTFSYSGKEICFQELEKGEIFGELSAIDHQPRSTSIIAQTDCTLGMIKAEHLWKLMEEYPIVMAAILKRLTSLIRFLCSRVYEYGALGTRERTRVEILRLAKNSMKNDRKAVITDMPTHESIANRIASHREAVTKELSYLTKIGLIEKKGNTLIVPDVDALSATVIENIA